MSQTSHQVTVFTIMTEDVSSAFRVQLRPLLSSSSATAYSLVAYSRNHLYFIAPTTLRVTAIVRPIQDDAGGKVNIFGSYCVDQCEEKVHMDMCLILNGYQDGTL
jgi:hypothetical protein